MNGEDYIEMEVTWPMRVQYGVIRARAGRATEVPDPGAPDGGKWSSEMRQKAWDELADELAAEVARQAERVATRVLHDQGKNGGGR